jgi:tetratricopeptide (TPR) repeat protein
MRIRNQQAPTPVPQPNPAGEPARAAPRSRRYRLSLVVLLLVGGAAAWGAWSLWRPDPLREVHAALDRRDFRAADELLAKHLERHPDDRAARMLAARSARRGGDLARAFDLLRDYKQKYRADEAHELELALIHAQGGDTGEAERLFAEYSGRPESPDTPFVMEVYLDCLLKALAPGEVSHFLPLTDDPAVLPRLRKAAELWLAMRPSPADQVQGLIWQGRVLRYAHDHADGVARFREALARDPESFDARLHLALALIQDAPTEAMEHFEILSRRRPNDQRLRYYLATGYRSFGRGAESRRLLNEILAADPRDVSALVELGLLDLDEGKVDDAEPRLRKALELSPNIAETNFAMCRCQQLAGRPQEAARYRKKFDEIEARRTQAAPNK